MSQCDFEGSPDIREVVLGDGRFAVTGFTIQSGEHGLRLREMPEAQSIGKSLAHMSTEPQSGDIYIVFKNIEGLRVFQDAVNYCALRIEGYIDD